MTLPDCFFRRTTSLYLAHYEQYNFSKYPVLQNITMAAPYLERGKLTLHSDLLYRHVAVFLEIWVNSNLIDRMDNNFYNWKSLIIKKFCTDNVQGISAPSGAFDRVVVVFEEYTPM